MISKLVNFVKISPNRGHRSHEVDTITIHCVVGQVTAEQGLEIFQPTAKKASANYVIGKDGSIGCAVDENERSWCSSNFYNDDRAITIEVASDTFDPYAVTPAAYRALVCLCADICRRYKKPRMIWIPDKKKTSARRAAPDEMRMTVHRWFAAKACPGDYLFNRMGDIAKEVTEMLKPKEEVHEWSKAARDWAVRTGIVKGRGDGSYGWSDPLTREEMVTILYRMKANTGA